MSRALAVTIAAAVAAALALALWLGLRPRRIIPRELSMRYAERQVLGQLRPGWVLRSVERPFTRPMRIVHRVQVPPELAGDLLMMSARRRRELVATVACPPEDDPIWPELAAHQDVEIELVTDKGAFKTVSCRDAL